MFVILEQPVLHTLSYIFVANQHDVDQNDDVQNDHVQHDGVQNDVSHVEIDGIHA